MSVPTEQFSWKLQGAIYGTAVFFGPMQIIGNAAIALFVVGLISIDLPLLIAFVLASRQILTVSLAIHSGALMDHFGTRRIITIFAILGAVMALAYPLLPDLFGVTWGGKAIGVTSLAFIAVLVLVQMLFGYAEGTGWIGIQTLVGQHLKGHALYAGRMTFSARIGGIVGPFAFGIIWDILGPWGGFGFISLWFVCGAIAVRFIPDLVSDAPGAPKSEPGEAPDRASSKVKPKSVDYAATFRLLLVPAVALVIMATLMRQTGSGVQGSFYIVWLDKEIGLTGTLIGTLIAVSNIASALAALSSGFWARLIGSHWALVATIGMSIVGVAIVPALGDIYALLMIAACIRGIGQGINLPMMITLLSRNVPLNLLGRVTAMRIAFNRGGGALVPLFMGALAEIVGIGNSFFIIGGAGVCMLGLLSIWVARSPDFTPNTTP